MFRPTNSILYSLIFIIFIFQISKPTNVKIELKSLPIFKSPLTFNMTSIINTQYNYSVKDSCVCEFISHLSEVGHCRLASQTFTSIYTKETGGFGNHFINLISALLVARILRIKQIYYPFPYKHYHLYKPFGKLTTADNITISVASRGEIETANHTMRSLFYIHPGDPFCPYFNFENTAHSIRDAWLDSLPRPHIDNDTLVIFLRGGKENWVHPAHIEFGQPPCWYYLSVMKKFNRTIAISMDYRNVCLNITIANGAEHKIQSVVEDLATLIYSKNLVLARSTFSRAAMYLSPFKKRFWTFDAMSEDSQYPRWHHNHWYEEFGNHENCRATDQYRKDILDYWVVTDDHIKMILESNCTWEHVKGDPSSQM